jgi:tetratricopeptide (TPR) repeat protein
MIVCLGSDAVAAQSADYDGLIGDAVAEFNRGDFKEARALFEQAHRIEANARTLRGMGVCEYELRHYVAAIQFLEQALASPHKSLTADQRAEVTKLLSKAKHFVGKVVIDVTPAGAQVQVDGWTRHEPEFWLDAGDYTIEISAPGYQRNLSRLRLGGGQEITLERDLSKLDVSPSQVALTQQSVDSRADTLSTDRADTSDRSVVSRWWFWTLIGGVVVGGAVAGLAIAFKAPPAPDAGSTNTVLRAP